MMEDNWHAQSKNKVSGKVKQSDFFTQIAQERIFILSVSMILLSWQFRAKKYRWKFNIQNGRRFLGQEMTNGNDESVLCT